MNKVDVDRRAGCKTGEVWIIIVSVHRRYRDAVLDILESAEFINHLEEVGKTNIHVFLSNLATDGDIDGLEKQLKRIVRDGRRPDRYEPYFASGFSSRCDCCPRQCRGRQRR